MPKFRPKAVVDAEQWKGPVELRKDDLLLLKESDLLAVEEK